MRLGLHSPSRSANGFTLVELMIVLVLIGIMSALILPEMAGTYADAKLKSTARRLISLCSFANSQAISHHETQRIRFDQQARRYRLESRRSGSDKGARGEGRATTEGVETEGEWDPSIRLVLEDESKSATAKPAEDSALGSESTSPVTPRAAANADTLVFYADGTANSRLVSLEDRSGFRLVIEINGTTSRVRIADTRRP